MTSNHSLQNRDREGAMPTRTDYFIDLDLGQNYFSSKTSVETSGHAPAGRGAAPHNRLNSWAIVFYFKNFKKILYGWKNLVYALNSTPRDLPGHPD